MNQPITSVIYSIARATVLVVDPSQCVFMAEDGRVGHANEEEDREREM